MAFSPPQINVTIPDGALGQTPANNTNVQLIMGPSSLGTAGTIYSISSPSQASTTLGVGPLASAAAYTVANTGGVVYAVPTAATTASTITAVAGTASPKITTGGTALDAYQVIVNIVSVANGTSNTTAQYQVSLDNGNTFGPTTTCIATAVTLYEPVNGNSTGITITFPTGTYAVGQSWTFATSAPCATGTDITNAFNLLINDPRTWGKIHFVGCTDITGASDAANITTHAALFTTIDGLLSTAASQKRFARGVLSSLDQKASLSSTGITDSTDNQQTSAFDTALFAGFAAKASAGGRLAVSTGMVDLYDPLSGLIRRRSASWPIMARVGQQSIEKSPGWVGAGNLPGVAKLWRDERTQQGADAARFLSCRTWIGRQGYYATSGVTMAASGSDYASLMNGSVIDVFTSTAYNAAIPYIQQSIRVNPNGTIFETDARNIENDISSQCAVVIVANGYVSPPTLATPLVTVTRTNNFLSSGQLFITCRATALGYVSDIELSVGFNRSSIISAQQ